MLFMMIPLKWHCYLSSYIYNGPTIVITVVLQPMLLHVNVLFNDFYYLLCSQDKSCLMCYIQIFIGVLGLGKGKKKVGKLGTMEKKELPVETDPEKLVRQVCGSNIYITGEDVQVRTIFLPIKKKLCILLIRL